MVLNSENKTILIALYRARLQNMTYKGYTIEIVDTNGHMVTIKIKTKALGITHRLQSVTVTTLVIDNRVNNPIEFAIEWIDSYIKG